MAKTYKKSCVPCASHAGRGIWQHNTGNLCWKGWLRGLALTDGRRASVAKNGRGVQFLCWMGHAAAAPVCGTRGPWGACPPPGSTPCLLRKDAAGYLWPLHWALFRPELPRRSAASSKRFALAGLLPWLLRLSLGPAASGCGHLCMGKGALSPKAFLKEWKTTSSSQQGSAIVVREKNYEIMHGQGWAAVREKSGYLIVWFIEQGLFTTISTVQWWSCGFCGGDVSEPTSNSQGVPVSQVLAFLSCQVDWTPGVLLFPLLVC